VTLKGHSHKKVGIANVISAISRPKLRTATIFKKLPIVPKGNDASVLGSWKKNQAHTLTGLEKNCFRGEPPWQ
jgi:hypothetical protein